MKPRTLLVFALLVAGLAAFVWFYERDLPSTDERAELAERLLPIEADDVERLEVEWSDGSVILEKRSAATDDGSEAGSAPTEAPTGAPTEATWRLLAPFDARADSTAVDGLVRRLVELEKERTLTDADRGEAGLTSPRGTVRLTVTGEERVVRIGAEVPASSNMIVGVEGRSELYVVPGSIWTDLTKEPGEWRDKRLFVGRRDEIARFSLERDDQRLLLARRGDDFWLESPLVDRAAQEHVDSLLSAIVGLRAQSFVDDPPADLATVGLDPPRAVLEVVLDGRESALVYEIGIAESESGVEEPEDENEVESGSAPASQPEVYLRAEGQLVTVTAEFEDHLTRGLADWRSHELVEMEVYQVDRARIADGTGSLELERDGGEWLRDGEKLAYGPATDFLYELVGVRAEGLADESEIALSDPRMTVELVSEGDGEAGGEIVETVTFHDPVGGSTPARPSRRSVVLMLSAATVDAVRSELADLRRAELAAEAGVSGESTPAAADTDEVGGATDGGARVGSRRSL